jgi:hypothetical protein
MGHSFRTVRQTDIREEPFVAADQAGGDKGRGKFHTATYNRFN